MDAGQISSDAIQYPLKDLKRIFILGIFTILSSLIIPGFFVLGYFWKVIKSSMEGSNELPSFNMWLEMFVDGLKVFLVLFVYSLIPLIFILLGIWAAILPLLTVPGAGSLLNSPLSLDLVGGMALIGIMLQIVVSFIIPIALANMIHHDKLSAAFRFGEIINKIKEIGGVDYLIWYIIMIIIAIAGFYICSFLIFPFIIGIIIVPLIIWPYLTMFFARSTALVYKSDETDHEYYRHSKQIK